MRIFGYHRLSSLLLGVLSLFPLLSAAQEPPTHAVAAERVTIKFQGGAFNLVQTAGLRKVLPPSDELPAVQKELGGFWYELRAGDGSVRYRRIIDNPVLLVFEGPNPGSQGEAPVERREGVPAERIFSLLIPASNSRDQLVLFGPPIAPDAQGIPAAELARFSFGPIIN